MNWVLKGVVSCLIFLSAAGCKDAVKLTVDDFTMALAAEGFSLEEEEYDQASENKRYFLVNPGHMYISVETAADENSARKEAKLNNEDIPAVKKYVERDGTAMSDIGASPEAFVRHNLILYVPVNYVDAL